MAASNPGPSTEWWASLPQAKASSRRIEASEVESLLKADAEAGSNTTREFLLVDVRRNDWEGGTIQTSINLPAQSFYQTRPTTYRLCKQAGVKKVIFYCGSSNGRGPRCANWMQDYLDEIGDTEMEAIILTGGIKGWVKTYGGAMMDWYDGSVWAK